MNSRGAGRAAAGSALRAVADQAGPVSERLTLALGLLVGALALVGARELSLAFPTGIDFDIPLRAAARWAAGGNPYPPSAMKVTGGPDLPYLYPPYLLPILAPLTRLPRDVVTGLWLILCAAAAVWTCRRLAIPWPAIPCVLVWPPFLEGLVTGNVQILAFAALIALTYQPAGGVARPREFRPEDDARNGLAAAAVGMLKVAQMLPLVFLLRRRPRAAVLGGVAIAALAVALLPFTGVPVYFDWLAQLGRASDPGWTIGGLGVSRHLGVPDAIPIAAGIAMALLIRGRDSAAWLGVALVVATPSVHGYTFLFLIPALLTVRRDVAFCLAAFYLGDYHTELWWAGCGLTVLCLASAGRWERMRVVEPIRGGLPDRYNPIAFIRRRRPVPGRVDDLSTGES